MFIDTILPRPPHLQFAAHNAVDMAAHVVCIFRPHRHRCISEADTCMHLRMYELKYECKNNLIRPTAKNN